MTSTYLESIRAKSETYRRVAQSILDKASAESRALTIQEQTDIDGLVSKAENALRSAELAQRVATPLTIPDGATVHVGDDNRTREPWDTRDGQNLAYGFGRFLRSVARASVPGGEVDPRLMQQRAASGMNEGMGSDGGFSVGTQFERNILTRVYSESAILSQCRRFTLGAGVNTISIPLVDEVSRATGSRWGGVVANWTAEGDDIAGSKPKLAKLELKLNKLASLGYASEEQMQDAESTGQLMLESFISEIRFRLVDAIFRGPGAGTPTGILGHPACVVAAKEQSQTES